MPSTQPQQPGPSRRWVTVQVESEDEEIFEAIELKDGQFGERIELARTTGSLKVMNSPGDGRISALAVTAEGGTQHLFFVDRLADPPQLIPIDTPTGRLVTWGGHWQHEHFVGFRRTYEEDEIVEAERLYIHRDRPDQIIHVVPPTDGHATSIAPHSSGALAVFMQEPDHDAIWVTAPASSGHVWKNLATLPDEAGGIPRFAPNGLFLFHGYDDRPEPDFDHNAIRIYSRPDLDSMDWQDNDVQMPMGADRLTELYWSPNSDYMLFVDQTLRGLYFVNLETMASHFLDRGIQPLWFDGGGSIVYRTHPDAPNQAPNGMSWLELDATGPLGSPVAVKSDSEVFRFVGGKFPGRHETEIVFRADIGTSRHMYAVTLDESVEDMRRISGDHLTDNAAMSEDRNQVVMRAFNYGDKTWYLVRNWLDETKTTPEVLAVPLPHRERYCFAPGDEGILLTPNRDEVTGDPASEARWYPDPTSDNYLRFDALYPQGMSVTRVRPAERPCGLEIS